MAQSNEWWVRISHAFSSHVRDETYVLERYEELAGSTTDAGTRFLLQLILADERHHHQVFEQLSAAAQATSADAIPGPPNPPSNEVPALLEQTHRFIEFEREDAASLKALSRELRPSEADTLWRLLVELMELDTEKHLRILDYLERHLHRSA